MNKKKEKRKKKEYRKKREKRKKERKRVKKIIRNDIAPYRDLHPDQEGIDLDLDLEAFVVMNRVQIVGTIKIPVLAGPTTIQLVMSTIVVLKTTTRVIIITIVVIITLVPVVVFNEVAVEATPNVVVEGLNVVITQANSKAVVLRPNPNVMMAMSPKIFI
ncbi:hypothetical protein TKK_0016546 [Trichogramma kaykai]